METIRVLLVDDEADFRASTVRVLARRGFEVREAESGARALEMLREERPDIVVLDLKMEGMDGIETLGRIRDSYGDLPVVILTGHGDVSSAMAGISLEIVDFLQKPVDVEILVRKLRHALAQRAPAPLREKTVGELMIPVESYRHVYLDQSVRDALHVLRESAFRQVVGRTTEVGHRSILVRDRSERLVGVLRMLDVLRMIEPAYLRDSPYRSCFTGMLLAQCKVFGDREIADLVDPEALVTISEATPLMEAVDLMVRNGLINLPVLRGDAIVGMLRDRDLFLEITGLVLGDS